jgi:hypothetical protein
MTDKKEGATLREKAKFIALHIPCDCDLDSWEPDKRTGHSWRCRIHRLALGYGINIFDLASRWKVSKEEAIKRLSNVQSMLKEEERCLTK